jgi:signal peptidase I
MVQMKRSFSGVLLLLVALLSSLQYAGSFSLHTLQRQLVGIQSQSRHGNEQNKLKWTRSLSARSLSATDVSNSVVSPGGTTTTTPPVYLAEYNTTVAFPSYSKLMELQVGEFFASETFTVPSSDGNAHDFCVKLYPRGGGHLAKHSVLDSEKQKSGFGMSYKVQSMFGGPPNEKVGVYLQFLPRPDQESVDTSFGLRLKGQQKEGRKFDVEWRAGMRFVSLENSRLAQGVANDFGAHLMQTPLLAEFLGGDSETLLPGEEQRPVQIETQVLIHAPPQPKTDTSVAKVDETKGSLFSKLFSLLNIQDVRTGKQTTTTTSTDEHNPEEVRVGRIVVPVLQRLAERPRMFQQGAYPGVEYRILRIVDPITNQDLFYSQPGASYDIKPIYDLVSTLERPWPVRVNERDIPTLYTPNMYNAISAIGSLSIAVTGLVTAFCISQAVSFFYIPSRSMDPTLKIGDVLLVDKVTPRLPIVGKQFQHVGDIVLFHPPEKLREIVARSGGRLTERDLFVKRIAGQTGDVLSVAKSGAVRINDQAPEGRRDLCTAEPLRLIEQYIEPNDEIVIGQGQVAVLGDCASVSIDSRVWGPLPESAIVGRPIVRLWPPSRFGPIPPLPTVDSQWKE